MKSLRHLRRVSFVVLALLAAATALAQTQTAEKPFQPQIGQTGKDVVWVPTASPLVDKMLDLARVTPQDYVIDLGSGDGRTVIAAARRGARALGIEFNPDMVALSRANAAAAGVTGRASFVQGDLFATDFSQATVLTMFLLPQINLKLRPLILDMKPGTRVVSNTFTMEDPDSDGDWEPDQTATVTDCENWCTALFWIVPARVGGTWKMPQGTLTLNQKFQYLTGTLDREPIANAKLTGAEIRFTAGATVYSGRVNGNTMQGTTAAGAAWTASR